MDEDEDEFTKLLRKFRKRLNLSQEGLANAAKLKPPTIRQWEKPGSTRRPQQGSVESLYVPLRLDTGEIAQLRRAAEERRQRLPIEPKAGDVGAVVAVEDAEPENQDTAPQRVDDGADSMSARRRLARWVRSLPLWVPVLFLATAVLLVVGGGVYLLGVEDPGGPGNLGEASISTPQDGDGVDSDLTVRGESSLRPGATLWLVIKPNKDSTYYLTDDEPIEVAEDGSWTSSLKVGAERDDVGADFDLFLLVSPKDGEVSQAVADRPADQFSARFEGMPPADSVVADKTYFELTKWVSG